MGSMEAIYVALPLVISLVPFVHPVIFISLKRVALYSGKTAWDLGTIMIEFLAGTKKWQVSHQHLFLFPLTARSR